MTNETSRMTKEEVLKRGKAIYFDGFTWQNLVFECGCNEEDYVCCYDTFATVDEMLEHIELICDGEWESVYEV